MKILLKALSILFLATTCFAWENTVTHKTIAEATAKLMFADDFLKTPLTNNGVEKKVTDWIQDGAELEDKGEFYQFLNGTARSLNHFHAPNRSMDKTGLTDYKDGISAIYWAQNGPYQISKGWDDWSWQKVREHQYSYLTATDKTSAENNLVNLLKGLGYQMHLIQDMSQPNHVRNDTHIFDGAGWPGLSGLETWAKSNNNSVILPLAQNPIMPTVDLVTAFDEPNLSPVARLSDTRDYFKTQTPSQSLSQGLAEYTNANFFSEDTVFSLYRVNDSTHKHYFPYPNKEATNLQEFIDNRIPAESVITEDSKTRKGIWIRKTGTDGVAHLARAGSLSRVWYTLFGEDKTFYDSFDVDEVCFKDYAQKLIPRAVGYSKAMLDYFYRGNIKVTTANPTDISFRSVKVTAQNNTPGETMGVGEVKLIIRYKALSEWPQVGNNYQLNYPPDDTSPDKYTYKVSLPQYVDLTNPQELTFDFSTDTLPYFFDDMTMQLVFKGKLGNEEGAVAVSQPVPINSVYSDFTVSLPASGVYAKAEDNTLSATFNELKVTAQTDIPGGLTGGSFELALEYRKAVTNQFLSLPVDTEPADAAAYIIRVAEKNGVNILQPGTPVELTFDLSSVPLSVSATDVFFNIIYKNSSTSKNIAVGLKDISEPTPVDVFNNTDRVCINHQWYISGSPEAYSAAGVDSYGNPLDDIFSHRMENLSFWTAGSGTLKCPLDPAARNLAIATANPSEVTRLGYILTNYISDYAFDEQVTPLDPRDDWDMMYDNRIYPGTGFTNQLGRGFSEMYSIRGKKMWWGASVVYDLNDGSDTLCGWETLQ